MTQVARAVAKVFSHYQQGIFDFVLNGEGNAIIDAKAGSGKTTTTVECVTRLWAKAKILSLTPNIIFLAFNKSIAEELKSRGVNAYTFHGLCISKVLKAKQGRYLEINKTRKLIEKHLSGDDANMYGAFISKLLGLAKQSGIGALNEAPDTESEWMKIVERHDMELEHEDANVIDAIYHARKMLQWSNASMMMDFDDMLYLAVKENIALYKNDYVFVDEAQDTNAIQRAILRKILKPTGRLIAVGDPHQAIYGFRGADSSSMKLIAEEFKCTTLPLSVSYRCAKAIIRYAQQWVPDIEAAPNAIEGEVIEKGTEWSITDFSPTDLVVCRTTKPLVTLAYKMLKARIPVQILGKEIGDGLVTLIKKMKAKGIERLIEKLNAWKTREVERHTVNKQETKAELAADKADAILILIDYMDETNRTIPALIETIQSMFDKKNAAVTLSTIHKAKGLEADVVHWLNRSKCPSSWAKQDWQMEEEKNLCVVASTRAKKKLITFDEVEKKKEA